jgi:hypothetical protein
MWKWPPHFSLIPMAVIIVVSFAVYHVQVKQIRQRAKKSNEVTEDPSGTS